MSNTQLFQGYSSTKRIRLPDDKVKIDTKTAIGASTMGTIIRAQKTGDYENVGNALNLHEVVSTIDDSAGGKTVVDVREVVVLKDNAGVEHDVMDPSTVKTLMDAGMTLVRTEHRDIMG
tara:strand:- start:132 stop:488 length:357 start_codon:yes stop_codon:yes gene_type:complete